ncbi:MAG: hypothetical protein COT71_04095 [Candidatus Andersenbacteria bacterium CG10_big_fil_rev_8_21_14_0_10_54_11]|uniref:Glycosyltransferase RgtA/B/C/D-like domain-containing protein n=1 Tax=Candidatus Andersenbacteria bacterium CG10_big_fil_rev_8_21_14_0_10_54_11 TaxID=1974485 RepID=A0A2M6WYJ8_9BACT|nr:MAG: hypothetical protein COT71_04095 [Candidatus Andersenbacteria bacterium CG10_big_fil_rev_8_21_14_0_10_54_11]
MSKQVARVLVMASIIVGLGVRTYQLGARSLWFDEAFSWRLTQFPVREMFQRAAADVHPPLYYVLLRGWGEVFGDSITALRSFSVVAGGITIYAAYLVGAASFRSRAAGAVSAALVAVTAFQIQYAWEARMYTLGTAIVLFASWALLHAVRRERIGWWILYALLVAAGIYTHYYVLFTVAGQVLFILGFIIFRTRGRIGEILQWPLVWYAAGAGALAAVMFLPWLPTFLVQRAQVQASYWIPPIGGWSIPDTFYRFYWPTTGIPLHHGVGWIVLAALPLSLTVLLWLILTRVRPRDGAGLMLLSGLVPFFAAIALSLFTARSIYQDRFFVFAQLFILIGWAGLLTKLPRRWLRITAPVILISLLATTSLRYWLELDIPRHPGAHAAVRYLFTERQGEEPIAVSSPFVYFAVLQYAEHDFNSTAPRLYSESGELAHFAGGPILIAEDTLGPELFATSSAALWIVDTTGFGGQPLTPPPPWRPEDTASYPEVFPYQGEVSVTKYVKK